MRIIVWGINYAPELTGIAPFNTGLCDFLHERGHQVDMVTTFPYYPFWKKCPGDRGLIYRADDINGVRVHRCWHFVPSRITTSRRVWHELSFGFTSLLRILFLAKPDVYVVVSPPLILGPLASFVSWLKRRPYVFHVQDLQPDAAVGLGMVTPGCFTKMLYRVEDWSYRHAAIVAGISDGMIAAFERKSVPPTKRLLFPNWIRRSAGNTTGVDIEADRIRLRTEFRQKFGISETTFLATYSGNLGRKQGLETLLAAAEQLPHDLPAAGAIAPSHCISAAATTSADAEARNSGSAAKTAVPAPPSPAGPSLAATPDILIIIVGDGVMRRELEARIAEGRLANVRMMPLLLEDDYHNMLAASDLSLILQAPGTGEHFFPSKLLSVLTAGSPVLSAADARSELAKSVQSGGFGLNVPAANPEAFAAALKELATSPGRLSEFRARTVWVTRFSARIVLGEFEDVLRKVANH